MKPIQIAYHANCPDGILAAAAFNHLIGPHVPEGTLIFVPISYSTEKETLKEMFDRANEQRVSSDIIDIIFLDYCPTRSDYVSFLYQLNVVIVDHHLDRVENILASYSKDNTVVISNALFTQHDPTYTSSGAWLTYWIARQLIQYNSTIFLDMSYIKSVIKYPNIEVVPYGDMSDEAVNLIKYVSDYDTWSLKYEDSPAVFNGLGIYASECNWDIKKVTTLLNSASSNSIGHLKTLYTGITSQIKDAISRAYNYPSDKNPIITFINAPKSMASEIARLTFLESNTSVVFVYCHNLKRMQMDISIRTADNTPISALELAKVLNGGGHENAAGCRLAIAEDPLSFILGDVQLQLLASVVSQMQNPRDIMS